MPMSSSDTPLVVAAVAGPYMYGCTACREQAWQGAYGAPQAAAQQPMQHNASNTTGHTSLMSLGATTREQWCVQMAHLAGWAKAAAVSLWRGWL